MIIFITDWSAIYFRGYLVYKMSENVSLAVLEE